MNTFYNLKPKSLKINKKIFGDFFQLALNGTLFLQLKCWPVLNVYNTFRIKLRKIMTGKLVSRILEKTPIFGAMIFWGGEHERNVLSRKAIWRISLIARCWSEMIDWGDRRGGWGGGRCTGPKENYGSDIKEWVSGTRRMDGEGGGKSLKSYTNHYCCGAGPILTGSGSGTGYRLRLWLRPPGSV